MWKGQGINAPAPGHELDLAASAQAVDGEKHLIPRKILALTRDLFAVTGMSSVQHVDHLSFYGRMLCHSPPIGEQSELLQEQYCIVGATGWSRMKAGGEIRYHRELQALSMKERAAPSGRLRSFGSVTSRGTVAKYLSEGGDTVRLKRENRMVALVCLIYLVHLVFWFNQIHETNQTNEEEGPSASCRGV